MPRYNQQFSYQHNSSSSNDVQITWNPDIEAYECSFPYNKVFIEWIKSNINTNDRSYDFDSSRKIQHKWMFSERVLEPIILPMMRITFRYAKFTIIDKKKVDKYNQGLKNTIKIDTDAWKVEFRKMVVDAGISIELPDKKQYLRACMFYHPDKNNGDGSKMSRLNEIWNTVFEPKTVVLEEPVNV